MPTPTASATPSWPRPIASAQTVKGEGDAKRLGDLCRSSFAKDPQFAQFYRSLEAYRGELSAARATCSWSTRAASSSSAMRGTEATTAAPARK